MAVLGFNSLKALYPDLIEKEWKFISNILLGNPDEIFPTLVSQQFFWKCPKCSTTYKSSPKIRIQNLQRGIESCPSCKGLRQKFINY
jgi:rubrerythrin